MEQEIFRDVNVRRCTSNLAFNIPLSELSHFALGLSEEVGEVCGILKRLRRGFTRRDASKFLKKLQKSKDPKYEVILQALEGLPVEDHVALLKPYWMNDLQQKLKDELSDVFGYWDLLAAATQLTSRDIIDKFNLVTKECGYSEFFEVTPDTPIIIK